MHVLVTRCRHALSRRHLSNRRYPQNAPELGQGFRLCQGVRWVEVASCLAISETPMAKNLRKQDGTRRCYRHTCGYLAPNLGAAWRRRCPTLPRLHARAMLRKGRETRGRADGPPVRNIWQMPMSLNVRRARRAAKSSATQGWRDSGGINWHANLTPQSSTDNALETHAQVSVALPAKASLTGSKHHHRRRVRRIGEGAPAP